TVPGIQTTASCPRADVPCPTTTRPSAEIPNAVQSKLPPGRSPSGVNVAPPETAGPIGAAEPPAGWNDTALTTKRMAPASRRTEPRPIVEIPHPPPRGGYDGTRPGATRETSTRRFEAENPPQAGLHDLERERGA